MTAASTADLTITTIVARRVSTAFAPVGGIARSVVWFATSTAQPAHYVYR